MFLCNLSTSPSLFHAYMRQPFLRLLHRSETPSLPLLWPHTVASILPIVGDLEFSPMDSASPGFDDVLVVVENVSAIHSYHTLRPSVKRQNETSASELSGTYNEFYQSQPHILF